MTFAFHSNVPLGGFLVHTKQSTSRLKKMEKTKSGSFHLPGWCSCGDSLQKTMQLQAAPFALFSLLSNEVSLKPKCSCQYSWNGHTDKGQIPTCKVSAWHCSACCWSRELCQICGQDLRFTVQCGPCPLHYSRIMGNTRYETTGRHKAEELNCSLGLDP